MPRERLATASLYLCTDARRERGDLAEFADAALSGGGGPHPAARQGLARRAAVRPAGGPPGDRGARGAGRGGRAARRAVLGERPRRRRARGRRRRACTSARTTCRCCWPATSCGADMLVGRSTHDRAQARRQSPTGVDYFCAARAGRRPPSRGGRRRAGPGGVGGVGGHGRPWFAIGGIDGNAARRARHGRPARRGGPRAHGSRGPGRGRAAIEGSVQLWPLTSNGIDAVTVRSRSQLAANPGCSGSAATSSSATQRSSALSRLGTVSSSSGASAITVV